PCWSAQSLSPEHEYRHDNLRSTLWDVRRGSFDVPDHRRRCQVDYITLAPDVGIAECIDTFDLSCCRISFDGRALTIHHVPSLLSKTVLKPMPLPMPAASVPAAFFRREQRIQKYCRRGFTI